MTRVEFKRFARANGYGGIDPGMDCVFAYNHSGGCIAWFQDDRKVVKKTRKSTTKSAIFVKK